MPSPKCDIAMQIKSQASSLGFDACGFAAAALVDDEAEARYDRWLEQGHNGCMQWAASHRDLRRDPSLLLDGAKTVISLALNYYPAQFQPAETLRVAYYAYGRDYHEVMREKLSELSDFIEQITGCPTRPCVDSAPIRERYWAQQSGLGFIGRNDCLILPGKGSFFFLGEIVTTAQLPPDEPCTMTCGSCGKCVESCPSGALRENGAQVICEAAQKEGTAMLDFSDEVGNLQRRVGAVAAWHPELGLPDLSTEAVMTLTRERVEQMTGGEFKRTFAHSAILRLRYKTLLRNARLAVIDEKTCK